MKKLNNFKHLLFLFFFRAECEEAGEALEHGSCPGAGCTACKAGRCCGTWFLTSFCPEWEQTEEAQIRGWRGLILKVHGRGSRVNSCHPQMGKAFPLAAEARGLQCWKADWAFMADKICSENCWRPGSPSRSEECTGSLQAEVLSHHWNPTEKMLRRSLSYLPACPRE